MVDADDPAIGRVDQATDPEALSEEEIEQELRENPNLQGEAARAFAREVSDRRAPVREEARSLMRNRLSPNPANPEIIQLRKSDGTLGPKVPEAGRVSLDVDDRGNVSASISGETVEVGSLDLNKGASGRRSEGTYSKQRHPAQQRGGGR